MKVAATGDVQTVVVQHRSNPNRGVWKQTAYQDSALLQQFKCSKQQHQYKPNLKRRVKRAKALVDVLYKGLEVPLHAVSTFIMRCRATPTTTTTTVASEKGFYTLGADPTAASTSGQGTIH